MGICESKGNKEQQNTNIVNSNHHTGQALINNAQLVQKEIPSFRCIYDIEDNNSPIQIINNREVNLINKEIEVKIKILNNGKKEKLYLEKKFDKKGRYCIDFIVEGNLTDMSFMFNKCSRLKAIEFISFKTENVTRMIGMFQECNELEYLNLSNFNTINVTDMGCMFNECHKLREIKGINNFNTTKVTKMRGMFQECNVLEYLDLSNFNTINVTDMGWMFNKCHKLREIKGINNFNTFNIKKMNSMFRECNELEYLDLSNFKTYSVTDMGWMFNNCSKLKEIKGINYFNTTNVDNMKCMFQGCQEIRYLDLSNFDTRNVTNMECMFKKCYKLKEIKGINNFNTSKVSNMKDIFDECNELIISLVILSKFNASNIINNNTNIALKKLNEENKKLKKEIDNIIAINFMSVAHNINFPIACKITDNFKTLEEKLYRDYPELKHKNLYFTANGNIINRYETLENNRITNGNAILIDENEFSN